VRWPCREQVFRRRAAPRMKVREAEVSARVAWYAVTRQQSRCGLMRGKVPGSCTRGRWRCGVVRHGGAEPVGRKRRGASPAPPCCAVRAVGCQRSGTPLFARLLPARVKSATPPPALLLCRHSVAVLFT